MVDTEKTEAQLADELSAALDSLDRTAAGMREPLIAVNTAPVKHPVVVRHPIKVTQGGGGFHVRDADFERAVKARRANGRSRQGLGI